MAEFIESDPGRLDGTPCFTGTRVPVEALFDHLRRGYTLDYFISQFPTVTRQQAEAVLKLADERLSSEFARPGR